MKTRLFNSALTVSLLTVALLACSAAQPEATSAPENSDGAGPKIQFASTKYDFGRALAGTQVEHDFIFTNTGSATLQITGVQPGCSCTTFGDWTHTVEPGKTGVIPIKINVPTVYNGSVTKTPSITCNDNAQPMVRFQLHATVYRAVDVTPNFGVLNIAPGASEDANTVVQIVNNEAKPLTLQNPTSNARMLKAEIKTIEPGKKFELIISTVPPVPSGNSQGLITIGTSSKATPTITVAVIAMVQPLINAIPATLTIPAGPITNGETVSVVLQNMGSQPVALSDPSVDVEGVQARITATQPGKFFTASVTFPDGFKMPTDKPMTLTIKTDNPRFPTVEIPIEQAMAPTATPAPPAPGNVRVITQ